MKFGSLIIKSEFGKQKEVSGWLNNLWEHWNLLKDVDKKKTTYRKLQ